MVIKFSDYAEKRLNRFTRINQYDVEDFVENEVDEEYEERLDECWSKMNCCFYNEEDKYTVFCSYDNNVMCIEDVRNGRFW